MQNEKIDNDLLEITKKNRKMFKENISNEMFDKIFEMAKKYYKSSGMNKKDIKEEINRRNIYKSYLSNVATEKINIKYSYITLICSIVYMLIIAVLLMFRSNFNNTVKIISFMMISYIILIISLRYIKRFYYIRNVNKITINNICLLELEHLM